MARNLALKKNAAPEPLKVASAAERVSGELDKVIHERMRLGIISALAANEKLSFSDLKSLLNTTDGNISVHARKLEEACYIACSKFFQGRMPRTEYRLTAMGKKAFDEYLIQMEDLVRRMKEL